MELSGPMERAVIQRGKDGLADIPVAGTVEAPDGTEVLGRILPPATAEAGIEWVRFGSVKGGQFAGVLKGAATGGPYRVQVKCGKKMLTVRDILVGDLYVLAGQSNMDGCGKLVDCEPSSRWVRCFYYDDRWDVAEDPLCWYNEAADPIHWMVAGEGRQEAARHDRDFRTLGAGLGVRFGKEIYKRTGVPVGLLIYSHGGTSLEQWSPSKIDRGGRSLYGSMIRRVKAVGTQVAGCLWYQGESDAATDEGLKYRANMGAFIQAMRRDLGQPKLPFLQVQLGPLYTSFEVFPHWNRMQTDQIDLEQDVVKLATVSAVDLRLDDGIHVCTQDLKTLGVRMAHVAESLIYGDKDKALGPRLKSAKLSKDRQVVRLAFSGVNKQLQPKKGIRGFTIELGDTPLPIDDIAIQRGTTVALRLRDPLPSGAALWYGKGFNPAVSLRDAAGLPVPVFGPVSLE